MSSRRNDAFTSSLRVNFCAIGLVVAFLSWGVPLKAQSQFVLTPADASTERCLARITGGFDLLPCGTAGNRPDEIVRFSPDASLLCSLIGGAQCVSPQLAAQPMCKPERLQSMTPPMEGIRWTETSNGSFESNMCPGMCLTMGGNDSTEVARLVACTNDKLTRWTKLPN